MKVRRQLIALASLFIAFGSTEAQQVKSIARIGYLSVRSASSQAPNLNALRLGLRELAYIEGKNALVDYRFAEGQRDRVPALARELVNLKLNVIVSGGAGPTRALQQATTLIPIVFAQDLDPVANGFVKSLAKPGGNITGLSTLQVDLTGKRLEILKEVVPTLSRVAVLGSTSADNERAAKETELAAANLGLKISYFRMQNPQEIEPTILAAVKTRPDGLIILVNSFERQQRKQIMDLAAKSRLPAMYFGPTLVEDGGLMSYGIDDTDLYRRAATYVDKILKGAKPADLPVEQPTKFELVINLKTAKQIGLTMPPHVLARADKVIK